MFWFGGASEQLLGAAQPLAFTATGLTVANPEFDTPTLVQCHNLTASVLYVPTPTFTTSSLTQKHGLAAINLATPVPEFGIPVFAASMPAIDLTALALAVAVPEFSIPTLTQRHVLEATALAVPAPSFSTPSLQRIVNLLATNLVVPTPAFDTPTLRQKHVLTATALDVAAPIFTLPNLGGSVYLLVGDDAIDNGLAEFVSANCIHVCSQLPASYAEVGDYTLGHKDFAVGAAFTDPEETMNGRSVTSTAISNGDVTAEGVPVCWAVTDETNSHFLGAGPMDGGVLVHVGQKFNLQAFTINRDNV